MAGTYQSGTKTAFYNEKRVINWHYNKGIANSHSVLLLPQDSIWTSQELPGYVKNDIVEQITYLVSEHW